MYISRHIEAVVERMSKRKAVVLITGARQVGKSTTLKELYKGVRYVTMDSPLVRENAMDNPSMFFHMQKPPVIIDEIQKAAEFFEYIKIIADESKKKMSFYLDESAFIKFVKATASWTGEMLNYSRIAEICGKDVKTVQKWMSVLESSGLVYLMQPYHNNFNKRLVKLPKLIS